MLRYLLTALLFFISFFSINIAHGLNVPPTN